ncbi:MAG: NAD(P)/FAD-dependent oxidoreductase [Candidatus Ancaeobacter aquaticus]|nr:NAD(P)/FAD-dependent oxidoreductase [Candidatus Ancaeobacter aquaticus]
MDEINITIIGAGVIGLSIAASFKNTSHSIYVLERHDSFGQETSSRNSEVIHAGIYYPQDSFKAKSCVQGNRMLYELCQKYSVQCVKTGKIIIACTDEEREVLHALYKKGMNNGVSLSFLDKKDIQKLEPHITTACAGIYSPSTGVIDSHGLMKHYEYRAQENGVELTYGVRVTNIDTCNDGYEISVVDSDSKRMQFKSRIVINCAGLESDVVSQMAGIDSDTYGYRLHMCKGSYFKVGNKKSSYVTHLVYPPPDHAHGVLGIHASLDCAGALKLGPDAQYVDKETMDYHVDINKRKQFYDSAKIYFPFIEEEDLYPDMAGIRPKLHGPEESYRDFVVSHEADKGFPGFINLIGIESPGLTAAPYIGQYVANMANDIM